MENSVNPHKGWLDHIAISLSVICAVHCLITPIFLVAMPIIATTFWVDQNFHLWMLLLVLPTTTIAVYSGCRRHRDRWIIALSAVGISLLITALVYERSTHHEIASAEGLNAPCCPVHADSASTEGAHSEHPNHPKFPFHVAMNTLGGVFLVSAHVRNFLLCRRLSCSNC